MYKVVQEINKEVKTTIQKIQLNEFKLKAVKLNINKLNVQAKQVKNILQQQPALPLAILDAPP